MSTRCTCDAGHATFGECLRAKNIGVAYCASARGHDYTAEKNKVRELESYRAARAQGIQPASTFTKDIRAAVETSNIIGRPYDAGAGVPPLAA